MPADKQPPEPAEILAITELSDIQFDALAVDAPMTEIGDRLLLPRFLPNTMTDCSPVASLADPNIEDISGGPNEMMDEMVPKIPDALTATDNNLDAPDETL